MALRTGSDEQRRKWLGTAVPPCPALHAADIGGVGVGDVGDCRIERKGNAMIVKRRTFEAEKHPKGSPERARLNCNSLTSEYLHGTKYVVCEDDGSTTPFTYATKREAELFIQSRGATS